MSSGCPPPVASDQQDDSHLRSVHESINEFQDCTAPNVKTVKTCLERMYSNAGNAPGSFSSSQNGSSINVPLTSLFQHALNVMQMWCPPRSGSVACDSETQATVVSLVSHVTSQMICDILGTYIPPHATSDCKLLAEVQSILYFAQSHQLNGTTNRINPERSYDGAAGAGIGEFDQSESSFGAVDEVLQSDVSVESNFEVKAEEIEASDDGAMEPLESPHELKKTKNIPPYFIYCFRGVRCQLCWEAFKGPKCVDDLVEHSKLKHKSRATRRFLKKLRDDNTPDKVVGDGMFFCPCSRCVKTEDARSFL